MSTSNNQHSCSLEFEIDINRTMPNWLVGTVSLFVSGRQIGGVAEEVLLPLRPAFERIANRRAQRADIDLYSMDAQSAIQQVERALFVDDSRTDAEVAADSARYTPFVVLPPHVATWRGWFAILVEWGNDARFVYSDPSGAINAIELNAGVSERALDQFVVKLATAVVLENSP